MRKNCEKLRTSSLPALRPGPRYHPTCKLFFIQFQVIILFCIDSSVPFKKNLASCCFSLELQRHWPLLIDAPVTKMLNISFWLQIFWLEFGRENCANSLIVNWLSREGNRKKTSTRGLPLNKLRQSADLLIWIFEIVFHNKFQRKK